MWIKFGRFYHIEVYNIMVFIILVRTVLVDWRESVYEDRSIRDLNINATTLEKHTFKLSEVNFVKILTSPDPKRPSFIWE